MTSPTIDPATIGRVYVRAPNWVGDVVMATGAFGRIRRAFPSAEILCGIRSHLAPILSGSPYFDGYIETPRARSLRGLLAQARALRERDCDLAVVLPNSLETGLIARMARIPLRVGYRQGRPFTMNLGLRAKSSRRWLGLHRHGPRRTPKPMPEYYSALLDLIGLPAGGETSELFVSDEEIEFARAWLRDRGIKDGASIVLLNAGASYGASKMWLPERFAELAVRLREQGHTPVFLSGPAEVEMVDEIARAADAVAATDPVISLDQLKGLVKLASMMVSTDTGPRHFAVAMGVPVVVIMGPMDRRYTDFALDRQAIIQKQLPCVPCQRKFCPLGHHDCMRKVTVDEVLSAGLRLLAG